MFLAINTILGFLYIDYFDQRFYFWQNISTIVRTYIRSSILKAHFSTYIICFILRKMFFLKEFWVHLIDIECIYYWWNWIWHYHLLRCNSWSFMKMKTIYEEKVFQNWSCVCWFYVISQNIYSVSNYSW